MRPTDICHPIELRVPAPRAFPTRSRYFRSGDAPQGLRPCAVNRGTGCFTTSKDRFGGSKFFLQHSLRLELRGLTTTFFLESRARAFSSHGADPIEPLTPLS